MYMVFVHVCVFVGKCVSVCEKLLKVRVDIEQWGTTFGENLSAIPKVQEFPKVFMKLLPTV